MSTVLKLYYGISTCSTTLATVFIVISVVTPAWETIRYNKSRIMAADLADPDVEVEWQNNSDWCTVSRTTYPSATDEPGGYTDESPVRTVTFVPLRILAGLWKVCDTLDDATRDTLSSMKGGTLPEKCKNYLQATEEEIEQYSYLGMIQSLTRSADSCAIVALIAVGISIFLGGFAACRQQIVFAMITGVCFFAAGIYILFTVTLMWLRKSNIERDIHDIDPVMQAGRVVENGWSMHLGWVAFIFCFISGVSWSLMSVELKKTRMNFMYSSNYDQICSM